MCDMTAQWCGHVQVLYAARRGFYFVLPKPGTQQPKGKDGGQSAPAGACQLRRQLLRVAFAH